MLFDAAHGTNMASCTYVTNMAAMLWNAAFLSDLSSWNVANTAACKLLFLMLSDAL